MATQKGGGGKKGSGFMGWGNSPSSGVGGVGSDSSKEKRDTTPYTLLIAVLSVLLTFFIVMPIMGALWVDLDAMRTSLVVKLKRLDMEIKRVEKLRRQLEEEQ
jgi:hypothetical protein